MPSMPALDENPRQIAAFRADLRHERLAARESMDPGERVRLGGRVEQHLAEALAGFAPSVIAFCWPMKGEFDARPTVIRLLGEGWRAVLPVAERNATPLVFRPWIPGMAMTADLYGIPVPDTRETLAPDIVLVPLVAFDEAGYRLGYGGGFFDRTLATLHPRPRAIGVGFEIGRVATVHPQAHDVRMDAIVTEKGLRRLSA